LLLGDLTHHGPPVEYARFKAAIRNLPVPVHMTLGNHDGREAFRGAFPNAPDVGGLVCDSVALNGATLVMLDTLDGPPRRPFVQSANGMAGRPIDTA